MTDYFDVKVQQTGKILTGILQNVNEEKTVDASPQPSPPTMVMLFSSTPRSGSSFLSELLSTYSQSLVFFFEPNHKIEKVPCIKSEECLTKYLSDKFLCEWDDDFQNWFLSRQMFLSFFNKNAKICYDKKPKHKTSCFESINLKDQCFKSEIRMMKIIRGRLNLLETMISDPNINLKIVQLYRDPRGFMKSINKFKAWNHEPSHFCKGLEEDMITYFAILEKYPENILRISYEHFSMDPHNNTKYLFEFAFGSRVLPESTLKYLHTHTEGKTENAVMSRTKNTNYIYQEWRTKIDSKLLSDVENDPYCEAAIRMMNHRIFGSLVNAKNMSLSLFL